MGRQNALLLGMFAVLALAGPAGAAPGTSVLPQLTSTSPGGFVYDGTHWWVTDAKAGFCRIDLPVPATLTNCISSGTAIFGQPAYDSVAHFVYLPDMSAASKGILRYAFNSAKQIFEGPVLIVAAALGGQRPGAITMGSDGNLYVSMTANANIVRVTTPTQAVATIATTISGKSAHGLIMVGSQLWVADQDGVLIIPNAVACGNKCKGTLNTQSGLSSPLSLAKDGVYVYVGTASGVFRYNPNNGQSDLYSNSYDKGNNITGLYSDVTAVGVDTLGNLFLVDDPTAGQDVGGAAVFTLPAGSLPGGQGPVPSSPPTIPPLRIPGAISNPALRYSSAAAAPKAAVFMGSSVWVLDAALGFCKVDPTIPAPSLTGCAVFAAGVVPGPPAFDSKSNSVYIPDTAAAGAGILMLAFNPNANPKLETVGAPKPVVKNSLLTAAAPASTAPTSLTWGPDGALYAAMAGSANILKVTAPSTANPLVRSIGTMNDKGATGLAFHNSDLYDIEKINASVIRSATLCQGTCAPLFLGVTLSVPTGIAADANYVYISDASHVWRYDELAATFTNLADSGLNPGGVSAPFSALGGIAVDTGSKNVFAADANAIWKIANGPQLLNIVPSSATPGASAQVTITGSGLTGATLIMPADITATGVTVVDNTKITATFAVNANAPFGTPIFSATTPVGTSNALSFAVNASSPTVTSITPNTGAQGDANVNVIIAGSNLTGVLLNTPPGVTSSNVIVNGTGTQITATFAIAASAQLGPGGVSVTTPTNPPVISGVLSFTVVPPPPSLTSINPISASQGANVPVTIVGTNLANAVMSVPAGIAASNVVITATQITANFVIAATAPLGLANVTVTTLGGTATIPFTINPPPPVLTSITPNVGPEAGSIAVVLKGTNLTGALLNGNLQAGITATGVTVVNDTQINAIFNLDLTATLGPQPIIVTTAAGASNALNFTVTLPPPPTLSGISPNAGTQGTSVSVTLTGTNFAGASVNAGTGITVSNLAPIGATQLKATFAIGASAGPGAQNVAITTPGGTSAAAVFTINPALTPTLTAITPNGGTQGDSVSVTLTGTNLTGVSAIGAGPGITVTNIATPNATQLTATFSIAANAAPGSQSVTVTTAAGTSAVNPLVTFTVSVPPLPVLTNITPAVGFQGASVNVSLTGTNLTAASVINAGPNITISNLVRFSATQVNATFAIAPTAPVGNQSVTITTPGGTSVPVIFGINIPPPPTLSGISPNAGFQGTSINVSLTGTNLTAAVINAPAGILVSNPVVVNPTQVTATFSIAAAAPIGPQNVTITTPGGSAVVAFTINQPPPTLTNIAPASGVQGTSVNVNLTGTNLTGASAINAGSGIVASIVTVTDSAHVTASFAIGAGAVLGPQSVTITTPGGTTTAPVTFTVTPPVPTLASIAPNAAAVGTAVSVTLKGANLNGGTLSILGAGGVTASNMIVSPSQITATLTVTSGAAQGARTISVTTPAGTSNAVTFTVLPPPPTIVFLNNTTIKRGSNVGMTVSGFNLGSLVTNPVQVLLNGVPVDSTVVSITGIQSVSQLQMKFNWTFAPNALPTDATHAYTVTVTTLSGTSNTFAFNVN